LKKSLHAAHVAALAVVVMAAPVIAATPAPDEIFHRAQDAWQMRAVPAYESFTLPCADTFLSAACNVPGDDVEFTLRSADGRTSARERANSSIASPVPQPITSPELLLHGGYIFGPGGAPLGFFRRIGGTKAAPTAPPNLAPDPLMKTIATVTSVARVYEIQLAGEETIDGHLCYHLKLRPLLDPYEYPLRDLWVDESTYDIVALTYAWNFGNNHSGLVHYTFAQMGLQKIWAIVHIDAQVQARHGLFSTRIDHISDDLRNITFPPVAPAEDFSPAPSSSPVR